MKRRLLFISILCSLLFTSCNKDGIEPAIDCRMLTSGLINFNDEVIAAQMHKLTINLEPTRGVHQKNINILVDSMSSQCEELTVELSCYACIETFPPISEILITIDSMGVNVNRTIDLLTPSDGVLKYIGMHY